MSTNQNSDGAALPESTSINGKRNTATNTGGRTPTLSTDVDDPSHPLHQHRRIVSDFEYKEILGEGSYSTVQAGRDKRTGKMYAIKRLDKAHIVKNNKVKYVMIERDALSRMNHPGIIKLYWTFKDNRSLYFVLDLAKNGELYTYIRQLAPFDMETAKFYAAELLLAIEHIHYRGVVHRDIKPENILLDDNLHIKVTDFGSAKIVSDENNDNSNGGELATPSRSFVGTAEYVSPELLRSESVSFETDFWALGCVIYQMLSGRSPFKAATDYLIFQKIKNLDYVMPDEFPQVAKDIIRKLLESDPEQRFGSEAAGGVDAVKHHPFFEGIDWEHIYSSNAPPLREKLEKVLKARAAAAAAATGTTATSNDPDAAAAVAIAFATAAQPIFSPSFEFSHPDLLNNNSRGESLEEKHPIPQQPLQQLYTPYSSAVRQQKPPSSAAAALKEHTTSHHDHPKNPFDDQMHATNGKTASQNIKMTKNKRVSSSDITSSTHQQQQDRKGQEEEDVEEKDLQQRKSHVFANADDKRSSRLSSAVSSTHSISQVNDNNNNNNSISNMNGMCDKSTNHPLWIPHLYPNESVIKSGRVLRKRGLITKKRNLILTNRPRLLYLDEGKNTNYSSHSNNKTSGDNGSKVMENKMDGNLRCEIPWTPQLLLELKGKSTFCIRTPEKNYTFEDKEHAEEWVNLINSMLIDSFGVTG